MATRVGNTDKIVTRGLHVALDFSENDCFVSGSGNSTINNLVGSNNLTTSVNGQVSHKAANGGVMEWVASGATSTSNMPCLRIPQSIASNALGGKSEATLTCWVKFDSIYNHDNGSFPDNNTVLMCWPYANSGTVYMPYISISLVAAPDSRTFRGEIGDSGSTRNQQSFGGSEAITLGTWTNIGVKWDGSTLTTFKDGSEQGTASTTISALRNPSSDFYIGSYNAQNWYFHDGQIAAAYIYDKALTSAEILQNYNANKSRFGL